MELQHMQPIDVTKMDEADSKILHMYNVVLLQSLELFEIAELLQ